MKSTPLGNIGDEWCMALFTSGRSCDYMDWGLWIGIWGICRSVEHLKSEILCVFQILLYIRRYPRLALIREVTQHKPYNYKSAKVFHTNARAPKFPHPLRIWGTDSLARRNAWAEDRPESMSLRCGSPPFDCCCNTLADGRRWQSRVSLFCTKK